MQWEERLPGRIWDLTTGDGDVAGSIRRFVPLDRGYSAWLRGPDPQGTPLGEGHQTLKAAKQTIERALIERLAKGPDGSQGKGWVETSARRRWELRADDGRTVLASVSLYTDGSGQYSAWVQGPGRTRTAVGRDWISARKAKAACERALAEREEQAAPRTGVQADDVSHRRAPGRRPAGERRSR